MRRYIINKDGQLVRMIPRFNTPRLAKVLCHKDQSNVCFDQCAMFHESFNQSETELTLSCVAKHILLIVELDLRYCENNWEAEQVEDAFLASGSR